MDSRHSPPPPSRNRILLLAALVLLVGGALLLSRVLPHAKNPARYSGEYLIVGSLDDSRQHSVSQFSESPTPAGDIRLEDFRLQPLILPVPGLSLLRMTYQDGLVTLQNQATHAPVWSGALAFASFSVQTTNGVQRLRDGKGRVIWINAAGAVKPNLLFQRAADGQGALDDTRRFSLEGVPGVVTVASAHGKPLGQIPIQLIVTHEAVEMFNDVHRPREPFRYMTQDGLLMADGTLLLTYRNASGLIVRRSKVFRTADGRVGNIG